MVGAGTAAAAMVRLMTALAPVSQAAKFDRDRVGQVTGHKTRAVFDRYHIVSPGDFETSRADWRRHLGRDGHNSRHTEP